MPFLLERESRKPVTSVMEWALVSRRGKQLSSNAIERDLRVAGMVFAWASIEGIDMKDPFAFAKAFTPNKIESSLRPSLERDLSDRKVKKLSVSLRHVRARMLVVGNLVDWILREAHAGLSVRTQAKEIIAFDLVRKNIMNAIADATPKASVSESVEGLAPSEVQRLLDFIHPDNPDCPWGRGDTAHAVALRHRNYVIVILMLSFGIRRGDLLKLYVRSAKLFGKEPMLDIRRRPDDPNDPRAWEPNAKTLERFLPLDRFLTRLLDNYINIYRATIPNARKSPYLILNVTNGRPLSARALNDIFNPLQTEFPDLYPHKCRHTCNDRIRAYCRANGIEEPVAIEHTKYLNGWLGDNSATYTQREARMSAQRISLAVQRELFGAREDVPF